MLSAYGTVKTARLKQIFLVIKKPFADKTELLNTSTFDTCFNLRNTFLGTLDLKLLSSCFSVHESDGWL